MRPSNLILKGNIPNSDTQQTPDYSYRFGSNLDVGSWINKSEFKKGRISQMKDASQFRSRNNEMSISQSSSHDSMDSLGRNIKIENIDRSAAPSKQSIQEEILKFQDPR